MNEWNAIGKKKKTQGPCLLPKPAVIHLPIAWLLYTAQTMRALSVKLRGVGHRLNNRARVATSTLCCKWSRHLVNGGAGGKGVFGLNRGTGNWTLYGWEHKQCKKNNNSTSRHAIRIYLQKHTHTQKNTDTKTHTHTTVNSFLLILFGCCTIQDSTSGTIIIFHSANECCLPQDCALS